MELRVGCCGFPQAREKYYKTFTLVEIQKTFYQLPRVATTIKWRQEAPPNFEFTLKAWQLITHRPSSPTYSKLTTPIPEDRKEAYGSFKPTPEVYQAWEETREVARALEAEVVVFQTPATFQPGPKNLANMREFFRTVERDDLILAWEPRGSWDPDEVARICRELDLVHVVDPFEMREKAGSIIYWRLHGGAGYRHRYTDEELVQLIKMLRRSRKRKAYVLFNNLHMWDNSLRFLELWEKKC